MNPVCDRPECMDRKRFIGGYPDTGHYSDDDSFTWVPHTFDETNHPSASERMRLRDDRQAKDPEHAKAHGITLYHGTTKENAESIAKDGFHLDNTTNGRHSGEGIYLTPHKHEAEQYGTHVVEAKVGSSPALLHDDPWMSEETHGVPVHDVHRVLGNQGYHGHIDPDDGAHVIYNPAHVHFQKVHEPVTTQKVGYNVWHEARGLLAGRGKPRRSDPGGQGGRGGASGELGQGQAPADLDGGDGPSTGLVTWHPAAEKDMRGLHHDIQKKVRARAQQLADGNRHASTHPLKGVLKGWEGTHVDFLHRMAHRSTPEGIEIGWVGPHDYEKAIRRLTSLDSHEAAVRHAPGPDGEKPDGIMVAIVPPRRVTRSLPIPEDGEDPENIHVTVAYLGKVSEHTKSQLADLPELIQAWAETQPKIDARVQGVGTFVNEGSHVLWAAVDMPGVNQMHVDLVDYLDQHGFEVKQNHSFTPHLTLSYGKSHFRFMPKINPVSFRVREIWCCVGGRWESFPLRG